jgi:hypothetical protein
VVFEGGERKRSRKERGVGAGVGCARGPYMILGTRNQEFAKEANNQRKNLRNQLFTCLPRKGAVATLDDIKSWQTHPWSFAVQRNVHNMSCSEASFI